MTQFGRMCAKLGIELMRLVRRKRFLADMSPATVKGGVSSWCTARIRTGW